MEERNHKHALPMGYRLRDYRVVDVLGVGGFGITYLAHDHTLDRRVAIKEYLPNEFAVRDGTTVHPKSFTDHDDFEWGLQRFLDEARTLARFRHPNLVRVVAYFEANRTAYIVMDYEEGESLDCLLERHGKLTEAQLQRILLPIVDGLGEVHAAGFLHRDIKPSNVFVRRSDESPVLLDFGAARQALGRKSKSLTAVASAGYSPPEQYESEGEQGPWTDIYALSALCYRAITGNAPIEAPRRINRLAQRRDDPLPPLSASAPIGYSSGFLEAVDWGLRVIATERPQSLDTWAAALSGDSTVTPESVGPAASEQIRSEPESIERKGRNRVAIWIATAVASAAAVAGVVWWLGFLPGTSGFHDSSNSTRDTPETMAGPIEPPAPIKSQAPSPLEGGNAILVVETEPEGVDVVVGDTFAGKTPVQLRTVQAGNHPVTLRHPDYETMLIEDQTFADGVVLRIERRLARAMGKLTVITEPANAWIERDGERLAEGTPVTLEGLPAGLLALTLGAEEHRTIRVEVDVPKDGLGMLERELARIPYGRLTLELEPSDATVTLPDISPAYRPGMRLLEGQHRVIVARTGYRQATRTLEVAGDTRVRIELAIDPQPLTVLTTPADAVVRLMDVEDEYRDGIRLKPGDYRIRVSAPEYKTLDERFSHGVEPTVHSVELVRSPQPFTVIATPTEATVTLVGHSEDYVAGMRLPPGEYRIGVSAEGYETSEELLRHGSEPTSHSIGLTWLINYFSDELASGGVGPEMVVVRAGSFQMGCLGVSSDCDEDELPVHEVQIPKHFALSKYEVTFADWDTCVAASGCGAYRPRDRGWGRGSRPVINVSWEDAQAYVSWLSRETGEVYRLPSESEWEYAARAGTTTKYFWGNEIGPNQANCWLNHCGDQWATTAPVGAFVANAFGLHEMHGNVWEWVEDCYNVSYDGAPTRSEAWVSGDCRLRVVRGGSWRFGPERLRSAYRGEVASSSRGVNVLGFRVARTLDP